jgi:hypothetical protein
LTAPPPRFSASLAPGSLSITETFGTRNFSERNLNSDEHFDDSFAFYRSETQNLNNQKERKNKMNPLSHLKKIRMLPFLIAAVVTIGLALPSQGLAQTRTSIPTMFTGFIDDFTPVLDMNGPWQVSAQ